MTADMKARATWKARCTPAWKILRSFWQSIRKNLLSAVSTPMRWEIPAGQCTNTQTLPILNQDIRVVLSGIISTSLFWKKTAMDRNFRHMVETAASVRLIIISVETASVMAAGVRLPRKCRRWNSTIRISALHLRKKENLPLSIRIYLRIQANTSVLQFYRKTELL